VVEEVGKGQRLAPPGSHALDLEIQRQPDDASCGPTCLHAVYRYFGDHVALRDLIAEVRQIEGGGTLAVNLANHALRRGYRALILTYNLTVFDPSWFEGKAPDLAERLRAQARVKRDRKLAEATDAYLEFLRLGGELGMEDLTPALLRHWLERDRPILTGLSATFLYRTPREIGTDGLEEDDLRGVPTGHFVVLCGWDGEERTVCVADPLEDRPRFQEHIYWLPVERVINSVLLGVLTYDANLLLLEPPREGGPTA
jgi:hypothetical protein